MELELLIKTPGEIRTWPPDCVLMTPEGEPIENVYIRDVKFEKGRTTVLFRLECNARLILDVLEKAR